LSPKAAKHLQSNLGSIELEIQIQQIAESAHTSWTPKATPFLDPLQSSFVLNAYQELEEQYDIRLCSGFAHTCDHNLLVFSRADPMKDFNVLQQEVTTSSSSSSASSNIPNNNRFISPPCLSQEESAEFVSGLRVVGTSALELFTHRDLLIAIKTDLQLPTGIYIVVTIAVTSLLSY